MKNKHLYLLCFQKKLQINNCFSGNAFSSKLTTRNPWGVARNGYWWSLMIAPPPSFSYIIPSISKPVCRCRYCDCAFALRFVDCQRRIATFICRIVDCRCQKLHCTCSRCYQVAYVRSEVEWGAVFGWDHFLEFRGFVGFDGRCFRIYDVGFFLFVGFTNV